MNEMVRLQKYIASSGVTSRRKAENLILQGKVKVNDIVTRELGTKINSEEDVVFIDGKIINPEKEKRVYLLFHKPRGCVTTMVDPEGRPTVMDYIKVKERVYPVGRLDYYSEGLLLLTNDGDLAHKVTHPSFEVNKVYEVKVFGFVDPRTIERLQRGVHVDGDFLKPQSVRIIKRLPNKTWLEFRLVEGKNREIRKLCENVGLVVDKLKRVSIEGVSITGIAPGKYIRVNKLDLLKALGMNSKGEKIKSLTYYSPKKSLKPKINNRLLKLKKLATDESFQKYRREEYVETMQRQKMIREQEESKKAILESPEKKSIQQNLIKVSK